MERLQKVVVSGLALIAVGVAVALAPMTARADEQVPGNPGGATQIPASQVGNAQGDGSGQ